MATMVKDANGNSVPVTNNNTPHFTDDDDYIENEVIENAANSNVKQAAPKLDSEVIDKLLNDFILLVFKMYELSAEVSKEDYTKWVTRNCIADLIANRIGKSNLPYGRIAIMKEFADVLSKKCADLMKYRKEIYADEFKAYKTAKDELTANMKNQREKVSNAKAEEAAVKQIKKAAEKVRKEEERKKRIAEAEENARKEANKQ